MRKRQIIPTLRSAEPSNSWLDIDRNILVEVTSEEKAYPIEAALLPDEHENCGWRAAQQIKGELIVPASKEYLKQEVANILNGFNSILAEIRKGGVPALTRQRIEMFNATILDKLDLVNDKAVPGRIRDHSVGVERANYRGAPAEDCEYLVDRLCERGHTNKNKRVRGAHAAQQTCE